MLCFEKNKDKRMRNKITLSISQLETKLRAEGIGTVSGRLYIGTAEKIPPSELVDTTGAGDAFIGAVLYGKLNHLTHYVHFTAQCVFFIFMSFVLPFFVKIVSSLSPLSILYLTWESWCIFSYFVLQHFAPTFHQWRCCRTRLKW